MSRKRPVDIPFTVTDVSISRKGVKRLAMAITPRKPMVIDRARVSALKKSAGLSPVELWLIDQVRKRGEGSRVVLFRAMNPTAERVWLFDPAMDEAELGEAGYVLTQALLPFHRRLIAAGAVLMVHTDWGGRECYAMRRGVKRSAEELQTVAEPTAEQELDRWILKNMLLHVALSLEHVVDKLLPAHLSMIERRWPRVEELVAAVKP